MKDKTKKILIYGLLEVIYTLIVVLYFLRFRDALPHQTPYEDYLLRIVIFIVPLITILFGPVFGKILALIYSLVVYFYAIAQNTYNVAFGSYFRIKFALSILDEVVGAKDSVNEFVQIRDFMPLIILTVFTAVFLVLYFVLQRKVVKFRYRLIVKLLVLLFIIPIKSNFDQFNADILATRDAEDVFLINKTDYYIYLNIPDNNQFVNKFGLLTFAYRDFSAYFETENLTEENLSQIEEVLNDRPERKDNAYTGIFEGKNVIFVMAESLNDVAISPELTPTLYMMKTNGINFENFNTPAMYGSTSDSEFMANTSLIPNSVEQASCYTYTVNTYPTTLARMFKENNYAVDSYHNCYSQYYNRDLIFPLLGYNNFFSCTQMGLEDCTDDYNCMQKIMWMYAYGDFNWMAYWISYSGHQPYEYGSVGVKDEYVQEILSLYPNLSEPYVAYLAKMMDLDRSMRSMIDLYRMSGDLDDTVFVIFGDHIVKHISFEEDSPFWKESGLTYYPQATYTDLFMYNSLTQPSSYKKTATLLDLLPTVANMWNMDYDNNTVLGRDIFDEDYDGFYFSIYGNWKTDNYSYNLTSDTYYANDGTPLTDSDYPLLKAEEEMAYYQKLRDVSKAILKIDYFREEDLS